MLFVTKTSRREKEEEAAAAMAAAAAAALAAAAAAVTKTAAAPAAVAPIAAATAVVAAATTIVTPLPPLATAAAGAAATTTTTNFSGKELCGIKAVFLRGCHREPSLLPGVSFLSFTAIHSYISALLLHNSPETTFGFLSLSPNNNMHWIAFLLLFYLGLPCCCCLWLN